MNNKSHLQSLLDKVNTLLDSNMKLDCVPQYGGYKLSAVPREFRFLQFDMRLTYKEMASFLCGILGGIRAGRGIIFS